MRALLLHANTFQVKVVEKSTRPYGILPEVQRGPSEEMHQCLVVFFCIEKNDNEKQLNELYEEIIESAAEIGTKNLMISPFVHLSRNVAPPEEAKKIYMELFNRFDRNIYQVQSSHFGYHKSLLLDIKGHPGSFRYREFV